MGPAPDGAGASAPGGGGSGAGAPASRGAAPSGTVAAGADQASGKPLALPPSFRIVSAQKPSTGSPDQPGPSIPRDAVERNNVGVRLYEAGRYGEAAENFEAAFTAAPGDSSIRSNLAYALANAAVVQARDAGKGRSSDAEASIDRALTLLPGNGDFQRIRGELLFAAGDDSRARHAFQDAELARPEDPVIQRYLGEIAYREEDLDEALRRWKRAVALGETDPALIARIEQVGREADVEEEMDVVHDRHFAVKFAEGEVGTAGQAELVLRALDRIRDRVNEETSWVASKRVAVIIYSNEEFRDVTQAHSWMGGVYDGKIRVPLRGVVRIEGRVETLLAHEYTHAIVGEIAAGRAPGWLDEGLAQHVAGDWSPARTRDAARRMTGHAPIPYAALEGSFTRFAAGSDAEAAYFLSSVTADYLMERFGGRTITALLERLAAGTPPEKALQEICRLDYGALSDAVADDLARRYPDS